VVFGASITADKVSPDAFKNTKFDYTKVQIAADPNTTVKVTIKYVYEDGTEAAPNKDFAGLKVGDAYTWNSPELEGYTADKLTVSGNAPAQDHVVTVTYKKNEVVTEEETTTPVVETPEEEKNPVSNVISLVVMVVLIAGIVVAAFFLMRSNKKNEQKAKSHI
jgi:preprotein translocase subunit YajC